MNPSMPRYVVAVTHGYSSPHVGRGRLPPAEQIGEVMLIDRWNACQVIASWRNEPQEGNPRLPRQTLAELLEIAERRAAIRNRRNRALYALAFANRAREANG